MGVEELAQIAGISVSLLRSYQSKGLLPPPRRVGRVARYGEVHLARLRRIAQLKSDGRSLREIIGMLEPDRAEEIGPARPLERLQLDDVADRSGVPVAVLRSWQASGIIRPRPEGGGGRYDDSDVDAAAAVLLLVGSGIPFDDFLQVADNQFRAGELIAQRAVELFATHVLGRIKDPAMVPEAVESMIRAVTTLASYTVSRQVRSQVAPLLGRAGP